MLRRKLIVSSLVIEEWCFWIKRLGCKVYLHPKVSRCRIAPILADILPYYVMQKYVSYRTIKYGFSWRLLMVRSGLLTFFFWLVVSNRKPVQFPYKVFWETNTLPTLQTYQFSGILSCLRPTTITISDRVRTFPT